MSEQEKKMKKTKTSGDSSLADANIDQYCQSVAELLKNINEKVGSRPRVNSHDEVHYQDYSDDMFQY